jgi:hypothetical protein
MSNEPTIPPPIVDEEHRVILRGELATDVIHDVMWSQTEHRAEFEQMYEIVSGHHLGDSEESWYQGVTWTALIRRKRDQRMFGFAYWQPVSKHGEALVEPNGDEHGIEVEYKRSQGHEYEAVGGQVYVFSPVREFTITGYEVVSSA